VTSVQQGMQNCELHHSHVSQFRSLPKSAVKAFEKSFDEEWLQYLEI
jgi:hypothetical protein